ncbi:MAG: hypothetical protein ACK5LP_00935 [Campylobacteraceae bacterium]
MNTKPMYDLLTEWVIKIVISDPIKFGGDDSSPNIQHEYIKQHYSDSQTSELTPYVYSVLSSIERIKNKFLLDNPQYDHRVKNRPRSLSKKAA